MSCTKHHLRQVHFNFLCKGAMDEKLHCLVSNRTLGRVFPGKARAEQSTLPGLLLQLDTPGMWSCEAGSPHNTSPWKEELLLVSPGCICPAEHGRTHSCSPQVPLPTHPCREGVAVPLGGSSRAAQVGCNCTMFGLPILYPMPMLTFLNKAF